MLDLLAASGHSLRDIRESWSPAMIVRMAEAAGRRRREEAVLLAQVIAAGTAAGFGGKTRPIEALARSLGVPYPGSEPRAPGGPMAAILAQLQATRGG